MCATALLLSVSMLCTAQENAAAKPAKPEAADIGGVKILPDRKGLEIRGEVCMEDGILDFLGVIQGGREYESVLSIACKPSLLHAGLLALGAKPGLTPAQVEFRKEREKAREKEGVPKEPEVENALGTRLLVTVSWKTQDGKEKEVPATSLLFNRKTKKVEPEASGWFFSGSYFGKTLEGERVYVADEDGAVICVVQDGSAVINLGVYAGNPYDSPDEGFVPNKDVLPPVGTAVVLHVKTAPEK